MKLFKILIPVGMIFHLAACAVPQGIPPADVASPEVKPKDTGGYYYYTESRLMRRRGKLDEAVRLLKEAVVRDEDSIFLKNELVKLYLHQNDYKAASGVAQDIIQKHPEHVPSLIILGGIYAALNQHAEAIDAYKKALALDPKSENIHFLLGSEYTKIKQPDKAMKLYQDLIQINPASFAGHFCLGTLYAVMKHYDKAEA
ncbi:MAG: tetratricopeptide repeat protein, partial [Desulfobacterales bacterium]|nr:tetratricopeptide repeat protein [Desulfobacterales bacterium]